MSPIIILFLLTAVVITATAVSTRNTSYTAYLVAIYGKSYHGVQGIVISDLWIVASTFALFSQLAFIGEDQLRDVHNSVARRNVYFVEEAVSSTSYYGQDAHLLDVVLVKLKKRIDFAANKIAISPLLRTKKEGNGIMVIFDLIDRIQGSVEYDNVVLIGNRHCKEKVKDSCLHISEIKIADEDRICVDHPDGDGFNVSIGTPIEARNGQIIGLVALSEKTGGCPMYVTFLGAYEEFIRNSVPNSLWAD